MRISDMRSTPKDASPMHARSAPVVGEPACWGRFCLLEPEGAPGAALDTQGAKYPEECEEDARGRARGAKKRGHTREAMRMCKPFEAAVRGAAVAQRTPNSTRWVAQTDPPLSSGPMLLS